MCVPFEVIFAYKVISPVVPAGIVPLKGSIIGLEVAALRPFVPAVYGNEPCGQIMGVHILLRHAQRTFEFQEKYGGFAVAGAEFHPDLRAMRDGR